MDNQRLSTHVLARARRRSALIFEHRQVLLARPSHPSRCWRPARTDGGQSRWHCSRSCRRWPSSRPGSTAPWGRNARYPARGLLSHYGTWSNLVGIPALFLLGFVLPPRGHEVAGVRRRAHARERQRCGAGCVRGSAGPSSPTRSRAGAPNTRPSSASSHVLGIPCIGRQCPEHARSSVRLRKRRLGFERSLHGLHRRPPVAGRWLDLRHSRGHVLVSRRVLRG